MTTREDNMAKRRARILLEARKLISQRGFEGLTNRRLAQAADVTVPTIYNLIGNQDGVLRALQMEAILKIEDGLRQYEDAGPIEMLEGIATKTAELFSSDPDYYRAAIMAGDRLEKVTGIHQGGSKAAERSENLAHKACKAAKAQGLLRGKISPSLIAEQMFVGYQVPFLEWGYGLISIEEYKTSVLTGFYLCLCADAPDEVHTKLLRKLSKLTSATPPTKAASKAKPARLKGPTS